MSIDHYIENLTLASATLKPSHPPVFDSLLGATRSGDLGSTPSIPSMPQMPKDLKAAVDAGTLVSFVEGVNQQAKDDVLFSVQLAHRGASGSYNRYTQTQSWYQKYVEILEKLGWISEQFAFTKYDQSEGEARMDKVALAVIAAIATQNQLLVLQESLKALEGLAEDDGTIRLFDFHTSAQLCGNFQIGAVQQTANGAIGLALGAFYFQGMDARRRFLFVSWGSQQMDFWTAAQKMTLNAAYYAEHREAVQKKLGASVTDFIGGLTLG